MSNSVIESFHKRLKLKSLHFSGCLYIRGNFDCEKFKNQGRFIIDLSSRDYIHLGDVLFFMPLIFFLSSLKPVVIIAPSYKFDILKCFLPGISNLTAAFDYVNVSLDEFVLTQPYAIDDVPGGRVVIGLGNTVILPDSPYPFYLLREFCEFIGYDYEIAHNAYKEHVRLCFPAVSNCDTKRLFVSPFIASGRFRDLFGIKKRAIIEYAGKMHREHGFEVFLFGSRGDNVRIGFPYVDIRGMPIEELIDLVRSGHFVFGIGFDNFWMHVADFFGVEYLVMFRGRFSRFGRLLHFSSVNVSFYKTMKRFYLEPNGARRLI